MEDASLSRANAAHAARLTKTIEELQARVEEQQAALEKLRASVPNPPPASPSSIAATQSYQLQTLTRSYEALTPAEPYLPEKNSPIPALLALRSVHRTIIESRDCVAAVEDELSQTQAALDRENDDLKDAKLMNSAITIRTQRLRDQIQNRTQKSSEDVGKELIRDLEARNKRYEKEMRAMVRGFNKFVENDLAPMLIVEEMGRPVVGEMMGIDELTLEADFNTQGKVKKKKAGDVDKRQKRIDEIWKPSNVDMESDQEMDEKALAAREMRNLTEDLMNAWLENEDDGYVEVGRESAASRYLVRSKVAHLHPRDAKKLRLIDFGRDLDS